MKIVVISCSLDPDSRSRVLSRYAETYLRNTLPDAQIEFVDLRDYPLPLCDGDAAYADPNVAKLNVMLSDADAMLLGVPIYTYDVNAAAKNLVELTGRAWEDKLAGFLCAAGGRSSYMSVMAFANSLMLDFRTLIVPRFVYAVGSDFEEADGVSRIGEAKVRERVEQLCTELAALAKARYAIRGCA